MRSFKIIAFLYGIAAYLVFFVTILYAIGFVMGLVVPKTIDTGGDSSVIEAVIVNLLLMALFAVQHSVMARQQFKAWWTHYVPKAVERSTYVLFASLTLLLLFWQWRPMPAVIWEVRDPDLAVTIVTPQPMRERAVDDKAPQLGPGARAGAGARSRTAP